MTASEQCLIIGAGHAGSQMAASLRTEVYAGRIALISDETDLPYHKPPLSKAFLKSPDGSVLMLRNESFYKDNGIDLLLGSGVAEVDCAGHTVTLIDGSRLPYTSLVFATGSRPRLPQIPGADLQGIITLRSFQDARRLKELVAGAKTVAIVGGGFIGMEIAHTLAALGREVTVVEAAPRILARAVAPELSAHIQNRTLEAGVKILLDTQITEFAGKDGTVTGVVTSDGGQVPADLVIVGIGALPNVELAAAAGVDTNNGILIDDHMRTSVPDVYAVGDCTNYLHWQAQCNLRLESVQNATDQAKYAAKTIAGHPAPFREVPWFWSDQGDMKIQTAGFAKDIDEVVLVGNPQDNAFSIYHFRGPRLIAVDSLNKPADHMIARRLLATNVSPSKDDVRAGAQHLKAMLAAAS